MIKEFFAKIFKKKAVVRDLSQLSQKEFEDYLIEQAGIHKQYLNAEKVAWEKKNELAKKLDCCNLGFTHTAFDGTYEEFKNKQYRELIGNGLQNLAAQQANSLQQAQQQWRGGYGRINPSGGLFGFGGW